MSERNGGGNAAHDIRLMERDVLEVMLSVSKAQISRLNEGETEAFAESVDKWQAAAERVDALEREYAEALSAGGLADAELDGQILALLRELTTKHAEVTALVENVMSQQGRAFAAERRNAQRAMTYMNPYSAMDESVYIDKKR